MKTIEEASLENSKDHYCMAFSEELHQDADLDFRAGVEFSQKWIPIERDEDGFTTIEQDREFARNAPFLVKFKDKIELFLHPDFELENERYTHWTPVTIR
jgi:hypothetical protein